MRASARTRNRRMRRMQQLVTEGDYFSASSLETRAPALYHEYIGETQF